jgi:DNA-directed RNA polymerase specialized sigma24 family protein
MKDHPAVLKYANSFAGSTDMELDDLLQEGRLAHLRARRAADAARDMGYPRGGPGYDPAKASFDTYATHSVYRGLCSALGRDRRQKPDDVSYVSIDEQNEDSESSKYHQFEDTRTPPPDRRLLLIELIRELPDDARAVVLLVLGDVGGLESQHLRRRSPPTGSGLTTHKARSYIRQTLGLSRDRAEAAFSAVAAMLQEMI